MSNLSALELVVIYADIPVLRKISNTPLWTIISPLFSNQHFWYLRAQTCVNFQLEWNSTENWHQVYNILENATHSNSFSIQEALNRPSNGYNSTAVKLLLRLGYDPSVNHSQTLLSVSRWGTAEILELLLSDSRIKPTTSLLDECLNLATQDGRLDNMKLLLPRSRVNMEASRIAVRNDNAEALKILDIDKISKWWSSNMLYTAASSGCLEVLKFLIRHPQVTESELSEALEYASISTSRKNKLEAVTILLGDKRTIVIPRLSLRMQTWPDSEMKKLITARCLSR